MGDRYFYIYNEKALHLNYQEVDEEIIMQNN